MTSAPVRYAAIILTISNLTASVTTKLLDYDKPEELFAFLRNVSKIHSNKATLIELGLSYENQPLYCLKIYKGNKSGGTLIVEFGAHAREWASHTSATHVIYELLNNMRYDELIQKTTWYIIPLLNPDGFRFSKHGDRNWRKNRRPNPSNINCVGVDVNRNFPAKWKKDSRICSEDYGGPGALSERESKAVARLLALIPQGDVDAYISVHTDAQCIVLPYAYTIRRPKTYSRLYAVAAKMKTAMESVSYPQYNIIQASLMYQVSGTVFDWVYDTGVPLVLTLELPFSSKQRQRFSANASEKIVIAKQCIAALVTCANEVLYLHNPVPNATAPDDLEEMLVPPRRARDSETTLQINTKLIITATLLIKLQRS